MRWIGSLLILLSGYLCSIWFMRAPRDHLSFLMDGQFLFHMLESEMRNAGKPLPELMKMLSDRTDTPWKNFFYAMGDQLQKGNDVELTELFDSMLDHQLASSLPPEEKDLFSQIGRGLFSDDLSFHRKNIQIVSDRLGTIIAEKRQELQNQTRVCRVLCLSGSALLVILLL